MVVETTQRISECFATTGQDYFMAIRKSLLLSSDMAHAVHPNYAHLHQKDHLPKIHQGIVLKIRKLYLNQYNLYAYIFITSKNFEKKVKTH